MKIFISYISLILFLIITPSNILFAQSQQEYIGVYKDNPEDLAAVKKVISDFQKALITKDGELLSSLMMYDDIFFIWPMPQKFIDEMRQKPGNEAFMRSHMKGELSSFIKSLTESKEKVEEKFYNIEIKLDGNGALVTFDYEFVLDEKVQNYGFETWNMVKVDGAWKIATVFWTVNFLSEP